MAYPQNFIRLSFGGNIYTNKDIWSNTINFGAGSIDMPVSYFEAVSAEIENMKTKIETWFKTAGMISQYCDLAWVKLALIGKDGKYVTNPAVYDFATPVKGSATGAVEPQRSLAVTFETYRLRAPGRYGRIFIPMYATSVGNDGLVAAPTAAVVNAATKTLLDGLNDLFTDTGAIVGQDVDAIVLSEKTTSHAPILKVKTGRVVDTIRSRRNKIKEEYSPTLPIDND